MPLPHAPFPRWLLWERQRLLCFCPVCPCFCGRRKSRCSRSCSSAGFQPPRAGQRRPTPRIFPLPAHRAGKGCPKGLRGAHCDCVRPTSVASRQPCPRKQGRGKLVLVVSSERHRALMYLPQKKADEVRAMSVATNMTSFAQAVMAYQRRTLL